MGRRNAEPGDLTQSTACRPTPRGGLLARALCLGLCLAIASGLSGGPRHLLMPRLRCAQGASGSLVGRVAEERGELGTPPLVGESIAHPYKVPVRPRRILVDPADAGAGASQSILSHEITSSGADRFARARWSIAARDGHGCLTARVNIGECTHWRRVMPAS